MNTSQNIELKWLTVAKHTASKREGHEQKVNNKNIEFKWLTVPKQAASTHEQKTNCKNFKKFRKVKVMLRVAGETPSGGEDVTSFFSVDKRRKQVTLFDPAACGGSAAAPEDRRVGVAAPKMFAFDAIFTQEDSQTEICSTALTDVIHAVINGTDGCLFCFGHARLGKSHTMLGSPDSTSNLGVIPCAITWLFRGINEQKQKTGARFSVRVSAVEVAGPSQHLKDLLSGHANDSEQSPAVYLRDDPLFGTQLQNHSELRVPSADKAAFYLDAALSSRGTKEESHLLYTLHVYQYSVAGKGGVAGGRSRLHLIDLGSCERGKASGGLPLSGLGNVLLAIFNGQKHLPHREHKLTQLLKECLSSLTCHAAMIAHVSPYAQNYTDTLTTIQLASRIHRMRRRKIKFVGASSGPVAGEDVGRVTGSSDVDPSSSEQSADTVIYVGPSEETDGEHPPVYLPSLNSGDNRCAMGKALRGSGAEQKPATQSKVPVSKSVPASPQRLAEDCQRMNGMTQEERSSPHRSVGGKSSQQVKSSGLNSSKSSPIRTVSKSKDQTKQLPTLNGSTPAEEQWIDGPRIPRSKVVEARNLHMLNKDGQHLLAKKETWVDGPLKVNNGLGYGFMDYHKKSMIKKWVENQTLQMQHRHKINSNSAKEKQQQQQPHYREMTVFKTCDDEVRESTIDSGRGKASGQEEEDDEEVPVVAPLPQSTVVARNGDISRVVPIERLQGGVGEEGEEEEEEMEVEIIEVEEPEEPVPMQDSCLQVTEEDIALCMGEIENPLPEVDQEEHPLRILSQENLTVVSTFTDSLSVVNDLERLFPRTPSFCNRPSSWLPTKEIGNDVLGNKERSRFEQLSRLHELYRSKVAVACSSKRLNSGLSVERARPVSRCQSLSLSDMLIQGGDPQNSMDFDNSSIASEPAYLTGEGNKSGKFCDNCRMSLNGRDDAAAAAFWFRHDNSRFHNFRFLTGSISSLRHPDGASNPNLQAEVEKLEEREPGNGAEREKIPGRGDDEEEELTVPPPLHSNLLTLSREGFDCGKGKHTDSSGYASITHRNSESGSHSQSSINGHAHVNESNNSAASVLQYCRADVERLERGWSEAQRNSRLRELKREQRQLKAELAAAKSRLLVPASRWSYELHVEDSWQDWTDSHSFLEALRQETLILRKRVEACKSHVLIATCFDCRPQYPP